MIKENGTRHRLDNATMNPKRHAPRGPVLRRDPMEDLDLMDAPRCTATNRQGARCGKPPIKGGTVCRMHGGAAPQVQQKAMDRLLALQNPAIDRLTKLIDQEQFPTVAYAASRDVLDRTMGKPAESQTVEHSGAIRMIHELGE